MTERQIQTSLLPSTTADQPPSTPPSPWNDLRPRLAGFGAIAFAGIVVLQNIVRGGSAPSNDASAVDVLDHFADHRGLTVFLVATFVASGAALLAFLGGGLRRMSTGGRPGWAFTDECDFVDVRGMHHRGAVAVGDGHQAIFDSIYAGSTVRYDVEDARCLTADIVLAVVGATLEAPTGPLQGTNHSRISAVITAGGGRWAITGFHNTLVRDG